MTSVVLPEPVAPTTAIVSPGCDDEVDAARARCGRCPRSVNDTSSNRTSPCDLVERDRARAVGDRGLGVEHLVDAPGRGLGLAGQRHDPAEDLEREREHQHVGHEGDQPAER